MPVLAKRASEHMNLIKINYGEFESVNVVKTKVTDCNVKKFDDVFDQSEIVKLPGAVKLVLKDDHTPTEMPPRRVPITIRDNLKGEIEALVDKGCIEACGRAN